MKQRLCLTQITCLAYCVDREVYEAIDYLKEQVRVLIEQQKKNKCILLDNHQRRRPYPRRPYPNSFEDTVRPDFNNLQAILSTQET
jgi:hypothetical protein